MQDLRKRHHTICMMASSCLYVLYTAAGPQDSELASAGAAAPRSLWSCWNNLAQQQQLKLVQALGAAGTTGASGATGATELQEQWCNWRAGAAGAAGAGATGCSRSCWRCTGSRMVLLGPQQAFSWSSYRAATGLQAQLAGAAGVVAAAGAGDRNSNRCYCRSSGGCWCG